jgi:universal stress protein E
VDLIVTDCHAGPQIGSSLLQLTDWELARLSPVPILIVKRQRLYRRPQVLAAVDPTHAYAKPLELDARILDCSVGIAKALHGTLHAVHAYVPTPFAAEPSAVAAAGAAMTCDSVAAADARAKFNRILQGTPIPSERRHLQAGHPADTIKRVVTQTGVDIVVMGSMSRSGLRRLLIGNTADKLLYRLPCDLLLVKPSGITDVVSRCERRSRVVATDCG